MSAINKIYQSVSISTRKNHSLIVYRDVDVVNKPVTELEVWTREKACLKETHLSLQGPTLKKTWEIWWIAMWMV